MDGKEMTDRNMREANLLRLVKAESWRQGFDAGVKAADNVCATPRLIEAVVKDGLLSVCRLLSFDLQRLVISGDDYNQAARDALDKVLVALDAIDSAAPKAPG